MFSAFTGVVKSNFAVGKADERILLDDLRITAGGGDTISQENQVSPSFKAKSARIDVPQRKKITTGAIQRKFNIEKGIKGLGLGMICSPLAKINPLSTF